MWRVTLGEEEKREAWFTSKSYFVYLIAFMMLHKSNKIGSKSRHDRGLGIWIIKGLFL